MDKRGKTKISVLVISLLLVSFSLYFVLASTSNTKSYDSSTNTITISNSGTEIAKIKLDTPHVYNVIRGKDRLVAEFTIDNYAEAFNIFNNMEFYDLKDNSKSISRQFTYKYKTITGTKDVPYYEKVCSIDGKNGTEICENKIAGYNTENIYEWKVLDLNKVLSRGNITMGIFIEVYPNEAIEWIPTLYGVKISEWAVWNESFNIGLTNYYKFEDNSDSIGNNGLYPQDGQITFSAGLNGKAGTFNDTQSMFIGNSTGNPSWNFTGDRTLNFWVKETSWASYISYFSRLGAGPKQETYQNLDHKFVSRDWGDSSLTSTMVILNFSVWFMLTIRRNSTTTSIWINGTQYAYGVNAVPPENFANVSLGDGTITGGSNLLGQMDEFGLWNRSLSDSEIIYLYDGGIGTFYPSTPSDTIPPNTTQPIITPQTPKSNKNLQCNATLTDDLQTNLTAYWKWYKNDISYLSGNTPVINGTNSLITTLSVGNMTKGENWSCEVKPFDGVNNGTALNSSNVTILNSAPNQSNPLLKTLSGKNLSTENLICYNQSTSDADKDNVTNIYNWYKNNQPLTILNLPFEINAKDYSGYNNNGTINGGAVFTDGKIGRALSFDGIDDSVSISNNDGLNTGEQTSFEFWINPNEAEGTIYNRNAQSGSNGFHWISITENSIQYQYANGSNIVLVASNVISWTPNQWYHIVIVHDNEAKTIKFYRNNINVGTTIYTDNALSVVSGDVAIGTYDGFTGFPYTFNGTIDELKIYNYALTQQQIQANYNLEYNKVVSQETSGGDNYMCQITPNDGEEDGTTLNSSITEIKWGITFDVRDSYSNASLANVVISCNYSGFNQAPYTTNPYGPYGFSLGNWECNFSRITHFDKTITFTADDDKTIPILMSESGKMSVEEHTWLEGIYNCVILGDCSLYNMLLEMNQTIGKIWEQTKPTDENVIPFENITNKVVDSAHNLTIDYTVNIPVKAGYALGTYLPIRIGYWFLNTANTTCYNQGDKPTGVKEPYCQPLIIETIGPMGGQVNFTVELQPSLLAGNYSIKRIIDIDPNNIWINYGQGTISLVTLTENVNSYGISVEKTGEIMPKKEGLLQNIKAGITGAITGVSQLISGWQIVVIMGIIGGVLITFIISRTILRLKKK